MRQGSSEVAAILECASSVGLCLAWIHEGKLFNIQFALTRSGNTKKRIHARSLLVLIQRHKGRFGRVVTRLLSLFAISILAE